MAINSIFSIARSSLFAHQQALAVTSTNLANANNPNYSRQVAYFSTTPPDYRARFTFGSGVAVEDVMRIRNSVTDNQIRMNNQEFYDASKRASVLSQIESLFLEPSEFGLSNLLTKFFNSWDEVALDPQSLALRTDVVQSAELLSEKIKSIYSGISQTKIDMYSEAKEMTANINTIIKQIHAVNKQIYEASVVNNDANDLLDKRDALLEELSQYVNINVSFDENNVANVSIGGVFAVDGLHHKEFKIVKDGDQLELFTTEDDVSATLSGGVLNGLLDTYNVELPKQLDTLDTLANTLMESVNAIHLKGYSLTDPPQTGFEFFTKYENGVLEINKDLVEDPFNLAISEDGTTGNNNIALELAKLKGETVIDGKTISEYYSDFITDVANEINLQSNNAESYSLVLSQLQQAKLEHSGVSTDEEMMNVMKYQRSYDAAAKLISVADDLLETLLTLV
ncbi:MAG: flagellar hook-associated protein FlgK [Ignavibacteriae bacterium]|nr:flagellar hook-associated protein FlgK [Ignavibacteriota bacterium]MCB9206089.1 flagellar hook-associated protein FlgK [Ignavibacteriales bacterium]MCB9209362.1 flagellar hook-associated protein FlgK [Ignavibacteriales bacterium]MCB9258005.1 flagellar hook-associated protein FlgK [Ignavibacteriales bacterium]